MGQCKIKWPNNLAELVAKSSKLQVAKMLGVSDKAVAKRLKRMSFIGEEATVGCVATICKIVPIG